MAKDKRTHVGDRGKKIRVRAIAKGDYQGLRQIGDTFNVHIAHSEASWYVPEAGELTTPEEDDDDLDLGGSDNAPEGNDEPSADTEPDDDDD